MEMVIIMRITIKTGKNPPMIVVCLIVVLLILLFLSTTHLMPARETLAQWQPEKRPGDMEKHNPTVASDINKAATLKRSNDLVVLGGSGGTRKDDPQHSYFSRGWSAEGQWWELSGISTMGIKRIELSFAVKGSNTGPKNFALEYSTDGSEWHPLTNSNNAVVKYSIDADARFQRQGPYRLNDGISDLECIYIRFINTDKESVIGDITKSSGTSYITDISITGVRN